MGSSFNTTLLSFKATSSRKTEQHQGSVEKTNSRVPTVVNKHVGNKEKIMQTFNEPNATDSYMFSNGGMGNMSYP